MSRRQSHTKHDCRPYSTALKKLANRNRRKQYVPARIAPCGVKTPAATRPCNMPFLRVDGTRYTSLMSSAYVNDFHITSKCIHRSSTINRWNGKSVANACFLNPPLGVNPFTPKSDQCQIFPAASPEILHHTVWRTWLSWLTSIQDCHTTNSHYITENFLFKRLGICTFWTWERKVYRFEFACSWSDGDCSNCWIHPAGSGDGPALSSGSDKQTTMPISPTKRGEPTWRRTHVRGVSLHEAYMKKGSSLITKSKASLHPAWGFKRCLYVKLSDLHGVRSGGDL